MDDRGRKALLFAFVLALFVLFMLGGVAKGVTVCGGGGATVEVVEVQAAPLTPTTAEAAPHRPWEAYVIDDALLPASEDFWEYVEWQQHSEDATGSAETTVTQ